MCRTTSLSSSLYAPLLRLIGHKRSRVQEDAPVEECTMEVPTMKKRRIVKAKKSVSFAATAVEFPAASDNNSESWLTVNDYALFKENVKRDVMYLATLHKSKQLHRMDRDEFCAVGIEKYTTSHNEQNQMKTLKQQRVMAVLGQQILQKQMGLKEYNQEPIQQMATALSQRGVAKAIQRASRLVVTVC